ncbi:class I SAM-dependent methyltransferase [Vibrio europaeus]|uniref:class I SAM-dependent methyltransferase n=1 Tax=Vibrio europaeus TaxID=300876 RepID=UPI0023410451|nr:class I SAM-dependent methyltransferase [Vibrio europaeus]MDC5850443.1 class I SAM-dependent methyltransferase [Vibrio europaeus]
MSMARLEMCAERINSKHKDYTLLDAGCRTMALKPLLNNCKEYFGSDLIPAEGVLECNLEKPLPFEDNSFDVVTALDVIEHLDNPHGALKELMRVAKKSVIVSLPNMFYIEFRMRFLRGGGISGKYSFPAQPILDRHRWILSYDEAVTFIRENTKGSSVTSEMILPVRGKTKAIAEPTEKWLAKTWPNLFAYGVLFEITVEK